jgi:hypothetical protein
MIKHLSINAGLSINVLSLFSHLLQQNLHPKTRPITDENGCTRVEAGTLLALVMVT